MFRLGNMSRARRERENLWSIGRNWLPWCLGLIFALTAGWVAAIAWDEVAHGRHESVVELAIAIIKESRKFRYSVSAFNSA